MESPPDHRFVDPQPPWLRLGYGNLVFQYLKCINLCNIVRLTCKAVSDNDVQLFSLKVFSSLLKTHSREEYVESSNKGIAR